MRNELDAMVKDVVIRVVLQWNEDSAKLQTLLDIVPGIRSCSIGMRMLEVLDRMREPRRIMQTVLTDILRAEEKDHA